MEKRINHTKKQILRIREIAANTFTSYEVARKNIDLLVNSGVAIWNGKDYVALEFDEIKKDFKNNQEEDN